MNEFRLICARLILDERVLKILSVTERRQISLFERRNFNEGNLFNFFFLDERTSYMTVSYSG